MAGKAEHGRGHDGRGGIGPVRVAAFAPSVIGQPLGDGAELIGDDGDRPQMIVDEVIGIRTEIGFRVMLADDLAARIQIFVP